MRGQLHTADLVSAAVDGVSANQAEGLLSAMPARASLGKTADGGAMVHFRCPGCEDFHQIRVGTWTFNGDLERPTFSPSVLVKGFGYPHGIDPAPGETQKPGPTVCHSFVTDGRIQFLGDCTHTLAGQTVDLPPWRDDEDDQP